MSKRSPILAAALAIACLAPPPAAAATYAPINATTSELVQLPPIGSVAEAELGGSMVTFSRQSHTPAIKISQAVTSTEAGIRLTIPPGLLALVGTSPAGKYYESVAPVQLRSLGVELQGEKAGLFVPNDPNAPIETYRHMAFGLKTRPVGRIPFEETDYTQLNSVKFRIEFMFCTFD